MKLIKIKKAKYFDEDIFTISVTRKDIDDLRWAILMYSGNNECLGKDRVRELYNELHKLDPQKENHESKKAHLSGRVRP